MFRVLNFLMWTFLYIPLGRPHTDGHFFTFLTYRDYRWRPARPPNFKLTSPPKVFPCSRLYIFIYCFVYAWIFPCRQYLVGTFSSVSVEALILQNINRWSGIRKHISAHILHRLESRLKLYIIYIFYYCIIN